MIVSHCGDTALLVTLDETDAQPCGCSVLDCVLRLQFALEQAQHNQPMGIAELVPAACTLLLVLDGTQTSFKNMESFITSIDLADIQLDSADSRVVEIPVVYDGPDLDFLASHFDVTVDALIDWHSAMAWRAAFGGFAPGFVYMVPSHYHRTPQVDIDVETTPTPRLDSPRTAIPAGSVALAGNFSSVYPQQSPGGWRLIGHTSATMFDLDRDPAALVFPGDIVHYVPQGAA